MKEANLSKAHWLIVPPRDGDDDNSNDDNSNDNNNDGGTSIAKLMATPEGMAFLQEKIDGEVSGLKTKNSELIDKQKSLKENLSKYDDVDLEKIQKLQKEIENNEEMKLLSEGKTEEVVERRVKAMRKDYDANITVRDQKIEEFKLALKQKDEKLTALVVDGQIREAYVRLDFEPTAMDDTIASARRTFTMDHESGKATPRDVNGDIIFSKDGKTPIGPTEWLENLSEQKKYLRRASSGAGANGSGSGKRGDVDTSKMTSTQRIAHGLANGGLS